MVYSIHTETVHGVYIHTETVHGVYIHTETVHGVYIHTETVHGVYIHTETVHGVYIHTETVHGVQYTYRDCACYIQSAWCTLVNKNIERYLFCFGMQYKLTSYSRIVFTVCVH